MFFISVRKPFKMWSKNTIFFYNNNPWFNYDTYSLKVKKVYIKRSIIMVRFNIII